MSITVTASLGQSNGILRKMIKTNEPFFVSRLGCAIGIASAARLVGKIPSMELINTMATHDGIYYTDLNEVKIFIDKYNEAIKHSTCMACFGKLYVETQNFYVERFRLRTLHFKCLEPLYVMLEGNSPWTLELEGKKVLVISPFADSFRKQIDAKFSLFKNRRMFTEGQEFVFYRSFNSLAGNRPHGSWLETFEIMCQDVRKLDFDVALIGCGGYGLPLCNFIYKDLNKSAVYVGGCLQLMFGVMGKRWENSPIYRKIIKENDTHFIRPSGEEKMSNRGTIEGGCYW